MERKDKLKAVIELFMDILSGEETSESKISSEIKKPVAEPRSVMEGLTNIDNIFIKNINNTQEKNKKIKEAAAKSIELIGKIEEIDKRKSFERATKKQSQLIKNLREEYSKMENKFHEDEKVENEIEALEESRNTSVNINPQIKRQIKVQQKSKTKIKKK